MTNKNKKIAKRKRPLKNCEKKCASWVVVVKTGKCGMRAINYFLPENEAVSRFELSTRERFCSGSPASPCLCKWKTAGVRGANNTHCTTLNFLRGTLIFFTRKERSAASSSFQ